MNKNTLNVVVMILFLTGFSFSQWNEQTSGVTSTLYSVSAVNNNIAWICGSGGKVLRTTNGGTNWNVTTSPNASLDLYNIWGIDSNRALVTGSSSTTYVYKTIDAGANWTQVFSQSGGFINAIVNLFPPSNQYAMIGDPVGGRWSLWHSVNNGTTWDSTGLYIPQAGSETGFNNSAFDIGPNGSDYFWFGTNNTRLYRGHFGVDWISQLTPGLINSLAILFTDSLYGMVGGSTGLLFTSNGGTNWSAGTAPGSGSINGFAAGYSNGEFFYTRGTSVYHTTNYGLNWTADITQTGTYTHIQKARESNSYNIWAIRNNGGISKYTYPLGIKPVSNLVPENFYLYQNYPNPFNPTTKIKFDIGTPLPPFVKGGTSIVKLVVYDVLGKEAAVLVNEGLLPGAYEVDWNASDFPSGIYFYRLITDNFIQTKKMVLIK